MINRSPGSLCETRVATDETPSGGGGNGASSCERENDADSMKQRARTDGAFMFMNEVSQARKEKQDETEGGWTIACFFPSNPWTTVVLPIFFFAGIQISR